ncbi:hypothetical protein HK102_001679 [Quaeritorhiza haematococci]|nr:hypothetical protein HK102_001679 [Quaeritorhiza haematococci]
MTIPKNRRPNAKKSKGKDESSKPLIDLTEDEQWRIINETGVLHKVMEGQGGDGGQDWLFQAILLAIPMTMLHGLLEYIIHMQYDYTDLFTANHVLKRYPGILAALVAYFYLTNRFRNKWVMQALHFAVGCASGCLLIHFSKEDETFGAMLKTPGLGVLWIYSVIEMKLTPAVVSLLVPLIYYFRDQLSMDAWKSPMSRLEDL